jgi:hypothetical protein
MQSGRLDEARSAVKAGLALNPTFAISRARAGWTAMSDDPTYLAQLERLCHTNDGALPFDGYDGA